MAHPNSALPTPNLIALFGPTGSGKSDLAEAIADQTGAQLINADAFQVYRGLDIGTNKSARKADYELIDIKEPHDSYGVGEFVTDACRVLKQVFDEGRDAIVVGGTGLYIRALFEEYTDLAAAPPPELRSELQLLSLDELLDRLDAVAPGLVVDRLNRVRVQRALEKALTRGAGVTFQLPRFNKFKLGLDVPPDLLKTALDSRVTRLLELGWIAEVEGLVARGVLVESPAFRAIGYSEISRYLSAELTFEEMVESVRVQTRQYAKRQRAWMRSEPSLFSLLRTDLGPPSMGQIDAILGHIKQASKEG